mgnify:CR=1 FL=1
MKRVLFDLDHWLFELDHWVIRLERRILPPVDKPIYGTKNGLFNPYNG